MAVAIRVHICPVVRVATIHAKVDTIHAVVDISILGALGDRYMEPTPTGWRNRLATAILAQHISIFLPMLVAIATTDSRSRVDNSAIIIVMRVTLQRAPPMAFAMQGLFLQGPSLASPNLAT